MSAVLVLFALIGVLVLGLLVGLLLRGTVLLGDRKAVSRLTAELAAEDRMRAATQATLLAMRRAASEQADRGHNRF